MWLPELTSGMTERDVREEYYRVVNSARYLERWVKKLESENLKINGERIDAQKLIARWKRLPLSSRRLDYAAMELRCEDLELKNRTLEAEVDKLRARLADRPRRLAEKPGPKGPRGEGTVYFFGLRDFLKVGFTTRDVNDRIRDLSTGTPEPITLIAAIEGTHETERAWQRRFKPWHHEREWFQRAPCEAIIAAELKEAVSDRA
jgi:hypothetical protein